MVVVDDVVSMTARHLFGTERETVLLGPGTLDSFAIRTARSDDIIERKIEPTATVSNIIPPHNVQEVIHHLHYAGDTSFSGYLLEICYA